MTTRTGLLSPRSRSVLVALNNEVAGDLSVAAVRRGVSVSTLISQGIANVLEGIAMPPELVVISTQQSNDIVRLIRADFDNTTIADWVHVSVSTVEAIRKELG